MLFMVHDETGQIYQSNKHFNPDGYDKLLAEKGVKFVTVDTNTILPPDEFFVDKGVLQPREQMQVVADKSIIQAGKQGVTFSRLPIPCTIKVSVAGTDIHTEEVRDGVAYLESPIPGTYQVTLCAWPYLPWTMDVECVQ